MGRTVIALAGKGGVGKTSIAAEIVRELVRTHPGARILAIDADPAVGLETALGVQVQYTVDDIRKEIAEHARRGIEVQYLAFPRAGLGSDDYRKMVSVWCAPDRRKALTDAKAGRNVPTRTCTTPASRRAR